MTLLAAVALYDMISKPVALRHRGCDRRCRSRGLARLGVGDRRSFGLIGAMVVPATLVFQGGIQETGTAFVALVFAEHCRGRDAPTLVEDAPSRGGRERTAGAGPARGRERSHASIVILAATFWLLYAGPGSRYQLRLGTRPCGSARVVHDRQRGLLRSFRRAAVRRPSRRLVPGDRAVGRGGRLRRSRSCVFRRAREARDVALGPGARRGRRRPGGNVDRLFADLCLGSRGRAPRVARRPRRRRALSSSPLSATSASPSHAAWRSQRARITCSRRSASRRGAPGRPGRASRLRDLREDERSC